MCKLLKTSGSIHLCGVLMVPFTEKADLSRLEEAL